MADDEESYLTKADKFLRRITGAEDYERRRDIYRRTFAEKAPKTAAAVEAIADALDQGAAYSPMGGPMLGMAKRAKATEEALRAAKAAKAAKARKTASTFTDKLGDAKAPKGPTKMKDRKGVDLKEKEPRVVPSGRSESLRGVREGGGGPTKMKDRRGLEIKPARSDSSSPMARRKGLTMAQKTGLAGVATGTAIGGYYGAKGLSEARKGVAQDRKKDQSRIKRDTTRVKDQSRLSAPMSNADVQKAYQELNRKHGTQRPVTEVQRVLAPGRVKTKPKDFKDIVKKTKAEGSAKRPAKKSATRIAFEKEFAKARKAGKKEFTFRGGKYKSYNTKLAK